MKIGVPELCLVVMVGASGSGKSTFAKKHFKSTEVLSSDYCRGLVSDDENDQAATTDAFDVLHFIASKRLKAGKLTVIDATNVQEEARRPLVSLARAQDCLPVAIVLDMPEKVCQERNASRADRNFGDHVVRQHRQNLRRSIKNLQREGFRHVFILSSLEDVEEAVVERVPLYSNLKSEKGPFDIIGDVHGCFSELKELLENLGYKIAIESGDNGDLPKINVDAPHGRKAVFVGDLVDRGPDVPNVLRLVMSMVEAGNGLCVAGNHDVKLLRKLNGKDVRITHGLAETLEQMEKEPKEFHEKVAKFIDGLISHYQLDDGKLVVAHAGLKQSYQGRSSGRVREFCLYGETTGETDEYGLPVRYNWAMEYRGNAMVVYGHTPCGEPEWLNRTICIDTGCVFGGKLTALRYPEKELVSVDAKHTYYESIKPFIDTSKLAPQLDTTRDEVLDIEDVTGKRVVGTRLQGNVTIREENSAAALEVMSRFAINPKWLVYLPPTMSPCETSSLPGYLEHPAEALNYYLIHGVSTVVCQTKHMGSRAVVLVAKDEASVQRRFGIINEGIGVCYTRTGCKFFNDQQQEQALVGRLSQALTAANFWEKFNTSWILLDCELMPWSAKARELIRDQYAAVGSAAVSSLPVASEALAKAKQRGVDVAELLKKVDSRVTMAEQFRRAYRGYCWKVESLDDYKLAPFQILATEGLTHVGKDHVWHMETLAELCKHDSILLATNYKVVETSNQGSMDDAIMWWEELTRSGGEGMVVKPFEPIVPTKRGFLQPAVKCRGPEYLRIIYGPEYSDENNLARLRARGLGAKRGLALREFSLGVEALERFVRHEPLYRVHECVFGVLALESEPVDPRL